MDDAPSSPFGGVPHQLRGFLSTFGITVVEGQWFEKCTACSVPVRLTCSSPLFLLSNCVRLQIVEEHRKRGYAFLLDALNQSASFLEDISGLTQLKRATEASTAALKWDEDGDEDF